MIIGVGLGFTIMVSVADAAHCPAVGVNVYVVVVVLFNAGDQVPVIPFSDVVGNGNKVAPAQIGPTGLKVGMRELPAVPIVTVAVDVQPLLSFAVTVYVLAANPVKTLLL